MNYSTINLKDYLNRSFQCECGRTHTIHIDTVEIGRGAIKEVPKIIKQNGYQKVFVISDCNTHKIAGQQVLDLLTEAKIPYLTSILRDADLVPDEKTIGTIMMDFEPGCDLIIAVGSGTLNDISRFISHRLGLPYHIIATAPSMDGYASTVAPLIKNNLKTTFECHMPQAIIADLEIIAQAPRTMIAAGFSDVIGKYTCLADWELSAIINDEYYCQRVATMTRQSLERVISLNDGIANGDPEAMEGLMEALILAGISMSYVGNSRPASGSEHHLSHFWEMRFLLEGKKPILHGTKVGMGTVLVTKLYQHLRGEELDPGLFEKIATPNTNNWTEEIKRVFLEAAPEVVLLEEQNGKNSESGHKQRIGTIAKRWTEIKEVLATVPEPEQVVDLLTGVGAPVYPSQVNISQELVLDGILYAKEIRPRYTILQLLWDLNLLSAYATMITKECDS